MPVRYLKLCTTNQQKLPCSWPTHHYLTPPANLQSWCLTSSCKDATVAIIVMLSAWLLPYQFFCLPCPFSMFHTHKATRVFSFTLKTQRQTWPLKLFAPPSQAQWQRAQFFSRPCPLFVFHTYKAPSLFSFILRTQWQTWPFSPLAPQS